jgi:hypothetical protein
MYKIYKSGNRYSLQIEGKSIPVDPENRDYQQFIQDVAEQGIGIVEGPTIHIPQYDELRREEYPPISEQLDKIYHSGVAAWKKDIKKIKDKYPKHMTEGSRIGEIPNWVREAVEEYLNNQ